MLSVNEVTDIFYLIDEFSKEFATTLKKHLLIEETGKRRRNKPNRLSDSEVMTLLIVFHLSGMRNLGKSSARGQRTLDFPNRDGGQDIIRYIL